jgi:DNA repair ATPase RecN
MKAIISDIVLFSEIGEKRHLTFVNGLNIISGDSKTGKSALIEIVDFCLFSKRSTIPVGKVTDWTDIFSVVYKLGDKQLIIARPIKDLNKCYFTVETNFDIDKNLL